MKSQSLPLTVFLTFEIINSQNYLNLKEYKLLTFDINLTIPIDITVNCYETLHIRQQKNI